MIGDEKKIGIKNVRLSPKEEERRQVRKLWQEERLVTNICKFICLVICTIQ